MSTYDHSERERVTATDMNNDEGEACVLLFDREVTRAWYQTTVWVEDVTNVR